MGMPFLLSTGSGERLAGRWEREREAHVKSCRMTRAGLKGTSIFLCCMTFQFRMFSMSSFFTRNSSQFRMAASRRTRMENGRRPGRKGRKRHTRHRILLSIGKKGKVIDSLKSTCGGNHVRGVGVGIGLYFRDTGKLKILKDWAERINLFIDVKWLLILNSATKNSSL